jgi:hypothetical protein
MVYNERRRKGEFNKKTVPQTESVKAEETEKKEVEA